MTKKQWLAVVLGAITACALPVLASGTYYAGPGATSMDPTFNTITATGNGASTLAIGSGGSRLLYYPTLGELQFESSLGYIYFSNVAATAGNITSNISAANAGATPNTAMIKFYPQQVLDPTDIVFDVGTQANSTSLFNIAYNGTTNINGSLAIGGTIQTTGANNITAGGGLVASNGTISSRSANGGLSIGSTGTEYLGITAGGTTINIAGTLSNPSDLLQVKAGTGTGSATIGGAINVTTADVSSSGNASNLISYTLPANALVTTNRCLKITGWGTSLNNANAKTVSLAFGGQTIISKQLAISIASETWKLTATVCRSGASTQDIFAEGWNEGGTTVSGTDGPTVQYAAVRTAGTQTETATIVIKGVATTATTTDITMDALTVEYL